MEIDEEEHREQRSNHGYRATLAACFPITTESKNTSDRWWAHSLVRLDKQNFRAEGH